MGPGDESLRMEPGERFARKYVVERVLGTGGMSVVVAALHEGLRQKVAIKLLSPPEGMPANGVDRFFREARAAAALRSEYTARVIDVDVDEAGRHFIVMEHLDGEDLGERLLRREPIAVEMAVGCVLHACAAMSEAHSLGIVHRDLKPQNLFATQRPDGTPLVKVLDFGISKVVRPLPLTSDRASVSTQGTLLGTPQYMSPEQIRTPGEIDSRTDIWSLGVILFELLTRRVPFAGGTIPDVLAAVLQCAPAAPSAVRAGVPPALCAVVLRCLEKDASRRLPSAAALARALRPWAPPWALDACECAERLDAAGAPAALVVSSLAGRDGLLVQQARAAEHAVEALRARWARRASVVACALSALGGLALWGFALRGASIGRGAAGADGLGFAEGARTAGDVGRAPGVAGSGAPTESSESPAEGRAAGQARSPDAVVASVASNAAAGIEPGEARLEPLRGGSAALRAQTIETSVAFAAPRAETLDRSAPVAPPSFGGRRGSAADPRSETSAPLASNPELNAAARAAPGWRTSDGRPADGVPGRAPPGGARTAAGVERSRPISASPASQRGSNAAAARTASGSHTSGARAVDAVGPPSPLRIERTSTAAPRSRSPGAAENARASSKHASAAATPIDPLADRR